ncbi:MAG: site-specific integrase [Aeromicrobium sp.]|uniref:tyrosine-type recombinase/integrase n=1 Tax=Aeromicrobium sp. TaxID=1871063 RepID=UPI0026074686|nr:site-specific integrase [Aeromicrobium sp.]MDF1704932.1 site-specific integrase [Aeromicrobium sp.]
MDAEAWLVAERTLVDRDEWTPPRARIAAEEKRKAEASSNTFGGFAERYLTERGLRPNTVRHYRHLLDTRILPYFGVMPLSVVTLGEIKTWRAALDPEAESTNAAAYRLLRSILTSAEEEELIDRAPPKIRGAGTAPVKKVTTPASFDELAIIIEAMPIRLRLFVVLAAFVGLREGELLELRRSDVDGLAGRVDVRRKIDKDVIAGAPGACPNCGRSISTPKTSKGIRTVHVPPPFLPMLQRHLLEHAAPGGDGLLFPGERTDHMSVRYLMDQYRSARGAAGRPDLTIHDLRHTALTLAGQHGATAAELQARAGHASQAAMAIYQHATAARDLKLAEAIGETYERWSRSQNEK